MLSTFQLRHVRSALGNVIEKLAEKSTNPKKAPLPRCLGTWGGGGASGDLEAKAAVIVVPYRESKLTRLLQNALGQGARLDRTIWCS